jgi:hypothetical protein
VAVHERVPDDEGHAPGRPAAAAGRSQYAALPCDTVLRAVARVRVRCVVVCVRVRCRWFVFENAALANQVLGPTASYMDQARHLDLQLDTMQRIDAPQGYADADSRFRVRLPARCPPPTTRDAKCDNTTRAYAPQGRQQLRSDQAARAIYQAKSASRAAFKPKPTSSSSSDRDRDRDRSQ